jgi:hypothetical protein
MDVVWQSLHRRGVDRATKKWWFDQLQEHSIADVERAFDIYLKNNREKPPVIIDIKNLLKPIFSTAPLPQPFMSIEENREASAKLQAEIKTHLSKQKDHKKWARDIVANPEGRSMIAIKAAKEALRFV